MTGLTPLVIRLKPGDDLKLALERLVRESSCSAACIITCVGSLERAVLRLAGAERTVELAGPLEIVSLAGTLSPVGCHLHLAVADASGQLRGGHVMEGCRVLTTAELVIGCLPAISFNRVFDSATGYQELVVERDQG
jgi:predicted DNA-binding protein with PD1-like motif